MKLVHGSLFSGFGGFDLAAELMGWENAFHCEFNPFCNTILKYYWPNSESYNDIRNSNFTKYANKIDVLTGGFPCQPFSNAGKRKGKEDERHLWPEMLRAIREIQPRWIIGENVHGILNWSAGMVFNEVQTELEIEGYEVWPYVLPAASVGDPHKRERVFFIAYRYGNGCNASNGQNEIDTNKTWINAQYDANKVVVDANSIGRAEINNERQNINEWKRKREFITTNSPCGWWDGFPCQPAVYIGNDGLPTELDGITFSKWSEQTIKAAGNAVVPQLILQLFETIQACDLIFNDKTFQHDNSRNKKAV